ncbi:hypothetical protein HDU67_002338 [Dinochytrium kinnereticum]|nr:hypothetical protein HDU67_002338 [Dinochytrium kinnereticum]
MGKGRHFMKQSDASAQFSIPRYIAMNTQNMTFPKELTELTNLEYLSLPYFKLTGSIPPDIQKLKKLKFLSLPINYLSGPVPSEIANLELLETLELYSNYLTGPAPSFIKNLWATRPSIISQNCFPISDFSSETEYQKSSPRSSEDCLRMNPQTSQQPTVTNLSSSSSKGPSSDFSQLTIVGISTACVITALLTAVIGVWAWRRKRAERGIGSSPVETSKPLFPSVSTVSSTQTDDERIQGGGEEVVVVEKESTLFAGISERRSFSGGKDVVDEGSEIVDSHSERVDGPSEKILPEAVMEWGCEEVAQWFGEVGIAEEVVEVLRANDTTGYLLLLLSDRKLQDMGVQVPSTRNMILRVVDELRAKSVSSSTITQDHEEPIASGMEPPSYS